METTPCKGHGGECKNNGQFEGLCFFCHAAQRRKFDSRPGRCGRYTRACALGDPVKPCVLDAGHEGAHEL